MPEEELTQTEKARLTASMDMRNLDDCDEEFLELLLAQDIPSPESLNAPIRRAITLFLSAYSQSFKDYMLKTGENLDTTLMSAMHCSLLKGYSLGMKLQRPLTTQPGGPQ